MRERRFAMKLCGEAVYRLKSVSLRIINSMF